MKKVYSAMNKRKEKKIIKNFNMYLKNTYTIISIYRFYFFSLHNHTMYFNFE